MEAGNRTLPAGWASGVAGKGKGVLTNRSFIGSTLRPHGAGSDRAIRRCAVDHGGNTFEVLALTVPSL